jgi:hypothetical protein
VSSVSDRDLALSVSTTAADAPPKLGWGELDGGYEKGAEHTGAPPWTPEFSDLDMGDVRCRPQLISGFYGIEDGAWRWMSKDAQAVLRTPAGASAHLRLKLYFPPDHMARAGGPVTVSAYADGQALEPETYSEPGGHELSRSLPPGLLTSPSVTIRIQMDRAVPPSGDEKRELGAVVQEIGLVEDK